METTIGTMETKIVEIDSACGLINYEFKNQHNNISDAKAAIKSYSNSIMTLRSNIRFPRRER